MCASLGGLEQRALGIRCAQLAVAVAVPYRDNVGGEMGSSCVPWGVGVDQVVLGVFGDQPSILVVILWTARRASGAIVLEKKHQGKRRRDMLRCSAAIVAVWCAAGRGQGALGKGVWVQHSQDGCLRRHSECERKWAVRGGAGEAPAQGTPERGLAHDAATENVRWGAKVLSVGESAWVRDCALSEGVHVSSGEHIL